MLKLPDGTWKREDARKAKLRRRALLRGKAQHFSGLDGSDREDFFAEVCSGLRPIGPLENLLAWERVAELEALGRRWYDDGRGAYYRTPEVRQAASTRALARRPGLRLSQVHEATRSARLRRRSACAST